MDCPKYSTEMAERKKGQHLRMEERGAIKALEKQGLGVRAIARAIGCAPTTVTNELRRGTPARKSTRGRTPSYSPRQGKQFMQRTERTVTGRPKQRNAATLSNGWAHKSGNTNGHWMLVAGTRNCMTCLKRQKWSVRELSTIWCGVETCPLNPQNCLKH